MKKTKNYQKKLRLAHKVLDLYQQFYLVLIEKFNCQFKKEPEYPLDILFLMKNGMEIKQKKRILRYSRITYVHKRFKQNLDYLFTLMTNRRERINKRMYASVFCIRVANNVLRKKTDQEHMNVYELDTQKIVATYQIYNILNEE